jgi:hypothetical protein
MMATREYMIGAVMGVALAGGLVIWKPFHKPSPLDHDITFSNYNFYDNKSAVGVNASDGQITINGSLNRPDLADDDPNRPLNNTYTIVCVETEMKCHVASQEQIGDHQVDEITMSDYKITQWTPTQVVATDTDDDDTFSCVKNTLTIERASQLTYYVGQPMNAEKPQCAKAQNQIIKYTIDDSRVWRYLRKATVTQ